MRRGTSQQYKRMKGMSMTVQEMRRLKTMMQTTEVIGKTVRVVLQEGTTREVLMAVPGNVTFVTLSAGLEVIFGDQRNVSNSSNLILSVSSKDVKKTRCSLSSFLYSTVSVQAPAVSPGATLRFLKTALIGGGVRDGTQWDGEEIERMQMSTLSKRGFAPLSGITEKRALLRVNHKLEHRSLKLQLSMRTEVSAGPVAVTET